jgi:RNA polymerase sigma-B factor
MSDTNPARSTESLWAYHRKRLQESPESPEAIKLRNRIVMENINLVREIAHRWADQCPESFEDLVQIGVIGACKAAGKFDPTKGNAFSSFAVPYIQGAIQHHLRDHWNTLKVPRRTVEEVSKVRRTQRKFEKLGRPVSEDEAAEGLQIPQHKWRWMSEAMSQRQVVSLDEGIHPIPDEALDEPQESTERQWLYQELEKLPDPQRTCVVERFFAELSFEEIAQRRGVSTAVVEIWIEQSLQRLRNGHSANTRLGERNGCTG